MKNSKKQKKVNILLIIFISLIFAGTYILLEFSQGRSGINTNKKAEKNTKKTTVENTTENIPDTETTSKLPEGAIGVISDNIYVYDRDVIDPMNMLNRAFMNNDPSYMQKAYPPEVIDYMISLTGTTGPDDYVLMERNLYENSYGHDFTISNEFVAATPLTESELLEMTDFYNSRLNTGFKIDCGFIVESSCTITYTDDEGNEKTVSSPDYYIAYRMNNNFYVDYLFIENIEI